MSKTENNKHNESDVRHVSRSKNELNFMYRKNNFVKKQTSRRNQAVRLKFIQHKNGSSEAQIHLSFPDPGPHISVPSTDAWLNARARVGVV